MIVLLWEHGMAQVRACRHVLDGINMRMLALYATKIYARKHVNTLINKHGHLLYWFANLLQVFYEFKVVHKVKIPCSRQHFLKSLSLSLPNISRVILRITTCGSTMMQWYISTNTIVQWGTWAHVRTSSIVWNTLKFVGSIWMASLLFGCSQYYKFFFALAKFS